MTGDKDVKEGTSKGNVTSISVSDDTQAQTVSKVPFTQNHIFVGFSSCSDHPFNSRIQDATNPDDIYWFRFTWAERRVKQFG